VGLCIVWLFLLQLLTALMVWLTIILGILASLGMMGYAWACYYVVRRGGPMWRTLAWEP
jgi:hypothetical protein